MKLSTRLRELRKQNGWKLREVAEKTGISVSYLSEIERGIRQPSISTLFRLSIVYTQSLSQLTKGVNEI